MDNVREKYSGEVETRRYLTRTGGPRALPVAVLHPPRITHHLSIGLAGVYNPLLHSPLQLLSPFLYPASLSLSSSIVIPPPVANIRDMSDSSENPWSSSPNAPQIPYWVYFQEKANFAGIFLGAISYGAPTYLSICRAHLIHSIRHSRDRHRPLLPMYGHFFR